mmetsp:Transcript_36151/g.104130  ORF Transcript_36151/g.104130 Transcript_36151/m.104130 type:complete len:221 (-) Transcript_36151:69-731(-)
MVDSRSSKRISRRFSGFSMPSSLHRAQSLLTASGLDNAGAPNKSASSCDRGTGLLITSRLALRLAALAFLRPLVPFRFRVADLRAPCSDFTPRFVSDFTPRLAFDSASALRSMPRRNSAATWSWRSAFTDLFFESSTFASSFKRSHFTACFTSSSSFSSFFRRSSAFTKDSALTTPGAPPTLSNFIAGRRPLERNSALIGRSAFACIMAATAEAEEVAAR